MMFFIPVLIIICILVILLARSGAKAKPAAPALPPEELNTYSGIEERLSSLIKHRTVSYFDAGQEDDSQFRSFISDLKKLYPKVHKNLDVETVGKRALLFTWHGQDLVADGVLLAAHFDVVPADDEADWTHPPFAGLIKDGYVWGRGSQDIKLVIAAILDAAEQLLAGGFKPQKTLYFAFGGDEEIGGLRGAANIAALLASRGKKLSFVLDEGSPITDGLLSFVDRPLAMISVAEKGYMDVLLVAEGAGGHSSMPPPRTVSGNLARAIARVEARKSRTRIPASVRSFLAELSQYSSFLYRLLFRNLWLTAGIVKAFFAKESSSNALVRTTIAPTMLSGSSKENVLANRATAILNVRMLPGDSSASIINRLNRIIYRYNVNARPAYPEAVVEASPEAPTLHEGWQAITAAVQKSFPEAGIVPFLLSGGTDTKHYKSLAGAIYRMSPVIQTRADFPGVHGRDERISIENLRKCAYFYRELILAL